MFAVADDVKIIAPPFVIVELAEGFPALALEEAGLTSHTVKNHLHLALRKKWMERLPYLL